jgi:hypothetical protein
MAPKTSQATETALIKQELHQINAKLSNISNDLEKKYAQQTELALVRLDIAEHRSVYVSQDQFWPVKVLVYGATALILTTVIGAIVALVVTRSP